MLYLGEKVGDEKESMIITSKTGITKLSKELSDTRSHILYNRKNHIKNF